MKNFVRSKTMRSIFINVEYVQFDLIILRDETGQTFLNRINNILHFFRRLSRVYVIRVHGGGEVNKGDKYIRVKNHNFHLVFLSPFFNSITLTIII